MAAMSKLVQPRRIVALVAVYVVALQALLLPLSVEASLGSSICAASATIDGSQPPASHETSCPCAAGCGMQCCAQALIGPSQVVIVFGLTHAHAMTPAPTIEALVRPAEKGPQVPRAPPAV